MSDRAANLELLVERLGRRPDRAIETLLAEERLLCGVCGSRATKRSTRRVGNCSQVYMQCKLCGHRGIRYLDAYNSSPSRGNGKDVNITEMIPRPTRTSKKEQSDMITTQQFRAAKFKAIEAALAQSAGLRDVERHFKPDVLEASDAYRGIGLKETVKIAAEENGYASVGTADIRGMLQAAFTPRVDVQAGAGFSQADISGILSNIANKFLLQGFTSVDSTWRKIAATRAVNDFKTVTSYSLTGGMTYEKIGATGELKHATIGQLSYTNQADTYGRLFAITRKDLINDDLGALSKVPFKLGRGAALKFNDVFYTIFLNNSSFFTSGNNNVTTGGGSALSSDALKDAVVKFRKQTDPDGLPIGVEPALLLVPSELEIPAVELMTSNLVNTGGSSSTNKVPNRNIWAQKFEVAATPYLSNSTYTGYSTTAWYLLAAPDDLPVIEVAFLNGIETPTVESADADFGSLGIQMRGYHDWGVALQEYRGGVRAAGA